MSGVAQVQPTPRTNGSESPVLLTGGSDASLMPVPAAGSLEGSDALSMLYLFESKDNDDNIKSASTRVAGIDTQRKQALADEVKAIQQQVDASKHHDFWSDLGNACSVVAQVAGAVASVALAVGTCGAAAPLAALAIGGAVLSTAAFVDGQCHVLTNVFHMDATTAGFVDLGLSLGGIATSFGANVGSAAHSASSALALIKTTATVTQGVVTVGAGVSLCEAGQAQGDIDRALAGEMQAQAKSSALERAVIRVLDEVQESDQKSKEYLKTIVGTEAIQQQTMTVAASSVKG